MTIMTLAILIHTQPPMNTSTLALFIGSVREAATITTIPMTMILDTPLIITTAALAGSWSSFRFCMDTVTQR
jgi:hypothetical protein